MSYIAPIVLDRGLVEIMRSTTRLTLHAEEPTSWAAANGSVIGYKSFPIIRGPVDAPLPGRMVTVLEINAGVVVTPGLATVWALLDDINQRVLAAGTLNNPLDLEGHNVFTLTAFSIVLPGL